MKQKIPIMLEVWLLVFPSGALLSVGGSELYAQAKAVKQGANKNDAKGGRKRFLSSEARTKSNKTEIDFDAASIDGERRLPSGVAIGGAKQDHEYDLINLRLRWHPEMIKSTSNLETGKGD